MEIMFTVFGRDISLVLQTREISLSKNNKHDIHIVITHLLVLVIIFLIFHTYSLPPTSSSIHIPYYQPHLPYIFITTNGQPITSLMFLQTMYGQPITSLTFLHTMYGQPITVLTFLHTMYGQPITSLMFLHT